MRRPLATVCLVLVALGAVACSAGGGPADLAGSPTTSPATLLSTTSTVAVLDADDLLALARRAVLRVRNTGCGELSTGTAWLAEDGRMVSNRHVVEGVRKLEMNTWDGRDLEPSSADVADDADISRIAGSWPAEAELVPLKVRTTRVEPGERISVAGYPEGNALAVTTGVATGYASDPRLAPRELLKLTTVIKPGNSGGPALDERGEVVGVVFAKELANDAALVIPIADVFGPTAAPLRPEPGCS